MNVLRSNFAASIFAALLLLFGGVSGFAQESDVKILNRALTKSLGEKTNVRTRRVIAVREEVRQGKKTLVVALNANNSPTKAGLHHGIFTDLVRVFKILKSWNWPDRVDQAMIGEYYPFSDDPNRKGRIVLLCLMSSDKIRRIDWDSFDARRIPEVADALQFYDAAK